MTATKWNWQEKREQKAFLALEDGTVFHGYSVGAPLNTTGEIVFNTGMTGYQEILSDPSYSGQCVVMTYPEIGNTGVNATDMESRQFFANGFIVHDLNEASNWRCEETLSDTFKKHNIPALAGIDTRRLTSHLRDKGTLKGYMVTQTDTNEEDAIAVAEEWEGLDNQDYASKVSCDEIYKLEDTEIIKHYWGITEELPKTDLNIVAYDFGIKWNILRNLRLHGMNVTVVPAKTPASDVLGMEPDGVFLSNGPADPAAVGYAIDAVSDMIGKVPLMGICLGHQILGLALGAKTGRLKFGHHGCNHPVMDMKTRKVEITSQNHNFTVIEDSLKGLDVEITHMNLNDNTIEGIGNKKEKCFSVQYHPEAAPGPHDPVYLFEQFRALIQGDM